MSAARRLVGQFRRQSLAWIARAQYQRSDDAVTLTFDDGPHPEFTPPILDALAENGIKATFFLIGKHAIEHPALARRMQLEGHSVGSHSMTHPDLRRIPPRKALGEVRDGRSAIEDVLGCSAPLFRPPMGHLTYSVAARVRAGDWHTVLWSTDTRDWKLGADPATMAAEASSARPGGIILLHDSYAHTAEGVRQIAAVGRTWTFQSM